MFPLIPLMLHETLVPVAPVRKAKRLERCAPADWINEGFQQSRTPSI